MEYQPAARAHERLRLSRDDVQRLLDAWRPEKPAVQADEVAVAAGGGKDGAATPQKTSSAGKPSQSQIEIWTGYTHYLLAADGLLRLTDALCKKKLDEAAFKKVSAVIGAAHVALQGVNEQLIKGLENMKEGKAPDFTLEPSPIPDWSADAEASVFAGAWEAIKAVLKKM